MSAAMDIERALELWMSEGARAMPEGLTDVVAGRIESTRQRNTTLPWLDIPTWQIPRLVRLGGTVAVVVAAVLVGSLLLRQSIPPVGPTPVPSPTVTPTPTEGVQSPSPAPSESPLPTPEATPTVVTAPTPPPPRFTTEFMTPALTYSLPEGWHAGDELFRELTLSTEAQPAASVHVMTNIYPPGIDEQGCPVEPTFDHTLTANELAAYLGNRQIFDSSAEPVLVGNMQGWLIDLVVGGLPAECASADVPLFVIQDESDAPPHISATAGDRRSFYVLDDRVKGTLVVEAATEDEARRVEIESILSSFAIDTSNPDSALGDLSAGTYQSQEWLPTLTYTVSDGWRNDYDDPSGFVLSSQANPAVNIELSRNVYPPQVDDNGCQVEPNPNAPHTAADLVAYLTDPTAFRTTASPITLGGLDGWTVNGRALPTGSGCPRIHYVVLEGASVGGTGRMAPLIVLDDGTGTTIVLSVRGKTPANEAELDAIVGSFDFTQPPLQ